MYNVCSRCESNKIAFVSQKSGECLVKYKEYESDYLPEDMGITDGNCIQFYWCLDCGQIQGKFPLEPKEIMGTGLCDKCRKNPANELHICPYKEDIDGDSETRCNCCEECLDNCVGDI